MTEVMKSDAKSYVGTKQIEAWPAKRSEVYQNLSGGEDPEGYAVLYPDGYKSWSPKEVFENAYQLVTAMSFGHALVMLQAGHRVARRGWNGRGMWLAYMPELNLPPFSTQDTSRKVNDRTAKWIGEDTPLNCLPYIAMWTADQKWQPGWLASQSNMLANDWTVVY